ncbi:dihydrofolate reductase family protein [Spongiimicrobium sp. 2-473A-2-J]|uniref:dihydrofolate reductase family protein n=1 Tax=Eudoraea algarum TaxID=3417568 RepID=UPI003D36C396
MEKRNMVFIGTSLDGYIADKDGGLEWLQAVPNPDQLDLGYNSFIAQVDALVMGRTTFETVCGFDMEWPYKIPVFVMSRTLQTVPEKYRDKATLLHGPLQQVLGQLHKKGYGKLYIDGGSLVQSFLREDLVDELIITRLPIVLGGGTPLFSTLPEALQFEHVKTEVLLDEIVQSRYKRKR